MDLEPFVSQLLAAYTTLEKLINTCPADLWDSSNAFSYRKMCLHSIFYADFYLSDFDESMNNPTKQYVIPPPIPAGVSVWLDTLEETDLLLSKEMMVQYLQYTRKRTSSLLQKASAVTLSERVSFEWLAFSKFELLFYVIRHLGYHNGQLNMLLRAHNCPTVRWTGKGTPIST